MILPDTNILIAYFQKKEEVFSLLEQHIQQSTILFSVITVGEFLVKAIPEHERLLRAIIHETGYLSVDIDVMNQGVRYRRACLQKTKRVQFLDCLIAATAKIHRATLVTFDTKDYPFPDLSIRQPEAIVSPPYPVREYTAEEKQTKELKRKKLLP